VHLERSAGGRGGVLPGITQKAGYLKKHQIKYNLVICQATNLVVSLDLLHANKAVGVTPN
jgi:hypothetical protein